MRSRIGVASALVIMSALAGCSGTTGPDGEEFVTDSEVARFKQRAQSQVNYMQRYNDQGDWRTLAEAICESLDGGQSYGNVSETTGAYIDRPASSAEVDGVILAAVPTICPELEDTIPR